MIKIILLALLSINALDAASSFKTWFTQGKVKGNVKYYYIQTDKTYDTDSHTSGHANSIGGTIGYSTDYFHGLRFGGTVMGTQPFLLPEVVDTSIISRDIAVAAGEKPGHKLGQQAFGVVGEAYVKFKVANTEASYGREVINTPFIAAKEVRMLPSAVNQGSLETKTKNFDVGVAYVDQFKQRTSDTFYNIVEHALGDKTREITGSDTGAVIPVWFKLHAKHNYFEIYNNYIQNFMNSAYASYKYANSASRHLKYSFAAQAIAQNSMGNANDYFDANTTAGVERIEAYSFGGKAEIKYYESAFSFATTTVLANGKHDSLVLPFDGTPLFTNMITSNNLFVSNYGRGLTSDSAYIGGTLGLRAAYSQGFNISSFHALKATFAYAKFINSRFYRGDQDDFNVVLSYFAKPQYADNHKFSFDLKFMKVYNNTSADEKGVINQTPILTQYRAIANYKF